MSNTGNTQQIIDYGATANDGTGDPLRTAFIKTDENFSNIWAAGPVGSNITIANNTIQTNNTNGNLVLRPNGTGVVQSNAAVLPNTTDVRDLGTADRRWRTLYVGIGGVNSTGTFSTVDGNFSGDVTIQGNLTVQGDVIEIGNITSDSLQIQLGNTATTRAQAANAGLVIGANRSIAQFLYSNVNNSWNTNIGLNVVGSMLANSRGNVWSWNDDFMSFPSGAGWRSDKFTLDEYIRSATNGYINIETYDASSNLASQLHLEHGLVQINILDGTNVSWQFNSDGTLDVPGDIIPKSNAVYSLGDSSLYWSNLWVANNTIYIGGVPLGVTAGNVLTVAGEPVLTNDSNTSISTTGNITADYFFGNGSQLTGIAANTGNVTFSDQIVIGTGISNVVGGLYLSPSPSSANDLQYLRVRGDVSYEPTHIHFDTGNNLYFNQFIGDDNKYVLLSNVGNIVIRTDDYAGNSAQWNFGTDGNLTGPNIVASDNFVGSDLRVNLSDYNWSESIANIATGATTTVTLSNFVFDDPYSGQVVIENVSGATEANGTWWYQATNVNEFALYTDSTLSTPVDSSAWGAYTSGGFAYTLDYNNIEINAQNVILRSDHGSYNNKLWQFTREGHTLFPYQDVARGDTSGGNITGYVLTMGDGTAEAIISTPNGNSTYNNSQRLVINPGKGGDGTSGEGGDIYLWAGRGGDAGGSGGDVKIRGGQGMVNGAGGYIRMEGGDGQGVGQAGYITMDGGSAVDDSGGYLRFRGGYSQNNDGGYIQVQGGYSTNGEGGDVSIIGGGSDGGQGLYGNIGMQSGSRTWTFNNAGNLVLPSQGNIVGVTPNNTGHLQWVGNSSGDGSGYTTLRLVPDDTVEGGDQYLIIDPTGGGHIHIRAGGTQDNSAGELFLGGEKNYVNVLDNTGVRIQNETTELQTNDYFDPADFTSGTWFTDTGLYYIQYTSTNAQLDSDPYQDINEIFVAWNSGSNSSYLTYGGSTQNLGGGVYKVRVNEAPPAEPQALEQISYILNVTRNSYATLTNHNFEVSADNAVGIVGKAGIQLTSQNSTDSIRITTDNADDSWTWDFGANGVMTAPGSISASSITLSGSGTAVNAGSGDILTNQVTGTQFNFLNGLYTAQLNAGQATANYTLQLPANAGTNGQVLTTNGSGALSWSTPASTYGDSNVVTLMSAFGSNTISTTGNVTAGNFIGSGSNVELVAQTEQWVFDTTGVLTVPGNITGANVVSANTFVSNAFNVVTAGNLSITSQYGLGFTGTILEDNGTLELIAKGGGSVVVGWDSNYGNGLGNIATVNFNEVGGGEGNILLRTGDRSATEYNWNFDSTGNLTLPTEGYLLVQTGIIGAGASPAPTLSGFSSIATTGLPGNITASGNLVATAGSAITIPQALANLTAVAGARAFVNDANLVAIGNFGQQISGGAGNTVPVWSDGTNWYIG